VEGPQEDPRPTGGRDASSAATDSQAPGRGRARSAPLHLSEDRQVAGSGGLQHRWRSRSLPPLLPETASSDTLAPFAQAILVIRWGTTVVSLLLAGPDLRDGDERLVVASAALLTYTLYRTVRPLGYRDDLRSLLVLLGEVAFTLLLLVSTGYWESPLAFSMLTAVAVAGFARGFGFGLRIATVAILAVSIPWALEPQFNSEDLRTSVQWTVEVLLVALVSGYARRISGEADQRQILAMDRLGRLSDANALLYQLHQVTQTLPASLDLDEVLDTTMSQLRELFEFEAVALLVFDDTDRRWHTLRREGTRPPTIMTSDDLPPPLARAMRLRSLVSEQNLLAGGGPGTSPSSASGLYAVLPARGSIIGLLSIEHGQAHHFTPRDVDLLAGFMEPAALAIDNARWFARLRTVGADEERTRIARDLHDRIGQSLAYLAFELDRIVKTGATGGDNTASLDNLREDVRGVIREVRDTLYDLRTDVTETQSLSTTLEAFLDRVKERSGLAGQLRAQETGRLPILQERELWRIAQEAVTNVERHARASQVTISWRCDGTEGRLEIADDGIGFPVGKAGRLDSYGLMGMRERAASIGARLVVDSEPGRGTRVRCTLDAH
jgi:signal transduction histidine kinase